LPLRKPSLAWSLLGQEIRGLLAAPALWLMLAVLSLLTGYSFIQAVHLYSEASRTALAYPEMAAGLQPLDGIFIPTFGAYYLAETLLLPFVGIRLVGLDKQSQTLKLLLQLPCSPCRLTGIKITAMLLLWLTSLAPVALALVCWHHLGGHIHWPEILALVTGHALYALVIITLALAAASITGNLPTAAMLCLAITLGFWVLDFASSVPGTFLAALKQFSLPALLRQCESGLLLTRTIAVFLILALFLSVLACIFLHPGHRSARRIRSTLCLILIGTLLLAGSARLPGFFDLSENRRHSLAPQISQALRQIRQPIQITIHLRPEDSRLQDLEHGLLAKLRRTLPNLHIIYAAGNQSLFAASEDESYGLIEYECQGRHDQSYSNSREEILTILLKLAGQDKISVDRPASHGYPLVTDPGACRWWLYIILPMLCLGGFVLFRNGFPFTTLQKKEHAP